MVLFVDRMLHEKYNLPKFYKQKLSEEKICLKWDNFQFTQKKQEEWKSKLMNLEILIVNINFSFLNEL